MLNTLLVSAIGIFFATLIGFIVALGRLSPNWLLSRISGGYVEGVRNLPLLFQILFWYLAVLAALPNPRQSISIFDSVFLSNRGLVMPKPIGTPGFEPFAFAVLMAIVAIIALWRYSRRQLFQSGKVIKVWPYALGLLIGLQLLTALIFGAPVTFEIPALKGFNFAGGSRVIPEFVALTLALSTYTAAFIAEIVRAGILSVHKGQMEAGSSLGLQRGSVLRLIVIPQAMRVILPPLTNQYLNLTKNSSLAVAIGYPDLVSVFAGTTLSQTGQAIEIIGITMGVYLLISLVTSAIMSFYGWRIGRSMAMSDTNSSAFVRQDLVPERAAPVKTTGFVGFLRTRLFNSPTNILITIVSALLLWFIVVPALRFLLVDAVWTGSRSHRMPAQESPDDAVGACWPFIQAKFIAVHLRVLSGAGTLAGQSDLHPRGDPAVAAADSAAAGQGPRTPCLFFLAFPVVAFFLLHRRRLERFRRHLDGGVVVGIQ